MDYLPRMEVAVKDFRVKYVAIITLFGRKMCFTAQKPPVNNLHYNRGFQHFLNKKTTYNPSPTTRFYCFNPCFSGILSSM